jgi:hypothetical protein
MAPVITPWQAGQEMLCCAGLGMLVATLRLFAPTKGRFAFAADFFAVGFALLLMQGYAARAAYAGGVRWYMAVGAALGAATVEQLLGNIARRVRVLIAKVTRFPRIFWRFQAEKRRKKRRTPVSAKSDTISAKKEKQKDIKKILPNEARLLYNSSV